MTEQAATRLEILRDDLLDAADMGQWPDPAVVAKDVEEALAALSAESADAEIARLRAVVERCEALRDEWSSHAVLMRNNGHSDDADDLEFSADQLATALTRPAAAEEDIE